MAFISLGRIDKKLIPILIGCVFCFLDRLIERIGDKTLSKNEVYTNVCHIIARFLNIIPFLILKKKSKPTTQINTKNNDNNKSLELIQTEINENKIPGKWRYIILTSIIYFFQAIIFMHLIRIQTSFWIIYILFTPLFNYLIYKIKLYKHHYFCIVLILLIGFIIDLVLGNFKKDIKENLFLFLMDFPREILFSLHNIIVKYLMEKKFVSVYEYSFYNSLINMVLTGIFAIFDYYYIKENEYENYFNSLETIDILFLLGIIGTQFFLNLSLLFTVKSNSPCHVFIMYAFAHFVYFDINVYYILVFFGLILIVFLSLIFNEIIEINFWGLSYNTKRNIIERAKENDLINLEKDIDEETINDEASMEMKNDEIYN